MAPVAHDYSRGKRRHPTGAGTSQIVGFFSATSRYVGATGDLGRECTTNTALPLERVGADRTRPVGTADRGGNRRGYDRGNDRQRQHRPSRGPHLAPRRGAHLAADLIASLDEERHDDAEVATAWADELERRGRQILRDPSSGESWDSAWDRIAGRLTSG